MTQNKGNWCRKHKQPMVKRGRVREGEKRYHCTKCSKEKSDRREDDKKV
jgi:hypothetical protein